MHIYLQKLKAEVPLIDLSDLAKFLIAENSVHTDEATL